MSATIKKLVTNFRLDLLYSDVSKAESLTRFSESIHDTLNFPATVQLSSTIKASQINPNVTELLSNLLLVLDTDTFTQGVGKFKDSFKSRKTLSESIPMEIVVREQSITVTDMTLAKELPQLVKERDVYLTELQTMISEVRHDFRNITFIDEEQFENTLDKLLEVKIPFTKKNLRIKPKSFEEITMGIKEYLKMVSLFGALVILLEKRIIDWVLLKAALGVLWTYIFWVFANEFFHITITDATLEEETLITEFRNKLIKTLNN